MSKHLYGLLIGLSLAAKALAQDAPPPTVIENVTVIPMDGERALKEHSVPGLIQAVRTSGAWNTTTQVLSDNLFSDETPEQLAARAELRYVTPQMRAAWDKAVRDARGQPGFSVEKGRKFISTPTRSPTSRTCGAARA